MFEGNLFIGDFEITRENIKRDGKGTVFFFRINRLASIKAGGHVVKRRQGREDTGILHA